MASNVAAQAEGAGPALRNMAMTQHAPNLLIDVIDGEQEPKPS